MTLALVVAALAVVVVVRLALRRRRAAAPAAPVAPDGPAVPWGGRLARSGWLGQTGIVALREVRERIHGRIFQVGTVLVIVVVVAAVVVPTLHGPTAPTVQTVGVLDPTPGVLQVLHQSAERSGDVVHVRVVRSAEAADQALRGGHLDVAVLDGSEVLTNEAPSASGSPADPVFVGYLSVGLGVLQAYRAAHVTPEQARTLSGATAVPVRSLETPRPTSRTAISVIGLVLLFFMLTQYCSWILIGVMQEKSSRVVEVLLATLRPLQLLGGKVLGIGIVALGQAVLVVAAALAASAAVGSDVLRGSGGLLLSAELLWLLLGYAFYCWVYAAAGSTAERQDQVQTLALPLSIPILLGYIFSLTVASTGQPDLLFRILAYVPPTAPFCMPILVGLGVVSWWQFTASVVITLLGTWAVAILAARIYRRAILQTRGRTGLRALLSLGR